MNIYESYEEYRTDRDTAVSVGKFDGLHRGHAVLLNELGQYRDRGLRTAVLVFGNGLKEKNLLTERELREALASYSPDDLVYLPLTPEFFSLSAESFIRDILIKRFRMKAIAAGSDFRFGAGRAGDIRLLRELSGKCGFEVEVFDKLKEGEAEVSSSEIRKLLTLGDTERAARMLGYDYFISGEIVHGLHLGSRLGFPTINLVPDPGKILPAFGVYSAAAEIEGRTYAGLLNIGVKPSIEGEHRVLLEVHLLHTEGDFYGKQAKVRFHTRIREERKFDSLSALRAQVLSDISDAEKQEFIRNLIDKDR